MGAGVEQEGVVTAVWLLTVETEPVERQQFSQYRMSEYTTPGTESGRMTEGSPK